MYLLDVRAWMCSDLVFLERCHFFLYCSNMVNPTVDRCLSGNSYSEWMIMDGHYIIIKLWMVIIYIVFNIMIWHNYKYLYYIILQLYTIKCISVYMYIIIHNYIYIDESITWQTWPGHYISWILVSWQAPCQPLPCDPPRSKSELLPVPMPWPGKGGIPSHHGIPSRHGHPWLTGENPPWLDPWLRTVLGVLKQRNYD